MVTEDFKGIRELFSNPIFGVLSFLFSIVSIILAIIFYLNSQAERELTCFIHPSRTQIVKAGQISELSIKYLDKEIKTDVTILQLAIVNRGKMAIHKWDILNPLEIILDNKTPILDAKLIRISSKETELKLIDSLKYQGILSFNWKILERDEGGLIQIIYSGNPNVNIFNKGKIEGQKKINCTEVAFNPNSNNKGLLFILKSEMSLIFFGIFMVAGILMSLLLTWIEKTKGKEKLNIKSLFNFYFNKTSSYGILIGLLISVIVMLILFFQFLQPSVTIPF